MPNILFTSWYVGLGGGETDLISLTQHLDTVTYQPHLLLPHEGQLSEVWRDAGWQVHTTHFRGASTYFVPAVWQQFPVVGRILELIQKQQIALIHSDYHTLPLVLPAAKRAGIPLIWTCWGWWFHPKSWQRGFYKHIDRIFARSKAIKEGFLGDPPFLPPDDIEIVYSGVDTVRFHPGVDGAGLRRELGFADDTPLVALIARFQDVKGHDVFQDMARVVAQEIREARFIVAGEDIMGVASDADYKARIIHTYENDPILQDVLHYIGFRDDAERVMAAADVVVCPSDFESYGRVNVEAMATGTPVVSTNQGGPGETVLHGETGFLVPPRQPQALAQYVIQLLQDVDLRHKIGAAGRQRIVTHFSAKAAAEPYLRVFEELLKP